jgi:hypothetical protein
MFFTIESELEYEQLNKRLEDELVKKENLEKQMETLNTENESFSKTVIVFCFSNLNDLN